MKTTRSRRQGRRGFTLIAVLLILAVLLGGLLAVLHDAGVGLRDSGNARSKEMVAGAMEFGMSEALDALQIIDPNALIRGLTTPGAGAGGQWDIFADWSNPSFVCGGTPPCTTTAALVYPPLSSSSPYAGELEVRIGLRLGQRTLPPSGEDVNSSYGYIVEVQIAVSRAGGFPDSAERASIGVRVPHTFSHAN